MSLQPIKDVSEYRRLKQTLRDRFDNERTGDQNLIEEQTKKYKPLLTSQQEISKTMQDAAKQIVESQNRRTDCSTTITTSVTKYTENTNNTTNSCSTATTTIVVIICITTSYYSITVRDTSSFYIRTGSENNSYTSACIGS